MTMSELSREPGGGSRIAAAASSARPLPQLGADRAEIGERRRDRALDVAIPLVLAAAAVADVITGGDSARPASPRALAIAVAVAATLTLVARRRNPVAVLAAVVAAAAIIEWPLGGEGWAMQLQIVVAAYTVASLRPWRQAVAIAGIAVAVQVVVDNLARGLQIGDTVSHVATIGAASAVGLYMSTRRAYVTSLHERAERLERERELLAYQAVADERVRIARELHDVVAHHVSLLVVQAGAVRETLPADHPARPVLDSMAATGRQAMGEMRRMLGLLRISDAPGVAEMGPQPGIDDVAALVAGTRAAGLEIDLRVEGTPRDVPVGVGLSAYRITQEALTNAVKHAGPAHVHVRLAYDDDALEVEVVDDGRGSRAAQPGGGHGLVGMRERVALFGGELRAGPGSGGGFSVVARLPLAADGRGR